MKKKILTSFIVTAIVGVLAVFFNAPKKNVKSNDKTTKNRPVATKEDSSNLFI